MRSGRTQYTQATGLPELRERIARWYGTRFGLDIAPQRIVVTAGASAALQLACLALFEAGDEVLMPDPSYPCNRHFVAAAGATARLLPASPEARFQLDAAGVRAHWNAHTRGVLLASPSNPTGTSIARAEMAAIVEAVRARGGVTLVDEIYLGLSYDEAFGHSALEHGDDVISINSFSKYFSMTGWRLGWLVLPRRAGGAGGEAGAEPLHLRRPPWRSRRRWPASTTRRSPNTSAGAREFRRRRDFVVPALRALGLKVPVHARRRLLRLGRLQRLQCPSSWDFCFDMMQRAHVALTPGRDFGPHAAERYVRLSFASSMAELEQALQRLARVLR